MHGRGHLSVELANRGFDVVSRDIVAYPDPLVPGIELQDVMATTSLAGFGWIVSISPMTSRTGSSTTYYRSPRPTALVLPY